jgi:uncharacterized protein (TIGR00290 family)
MQPKAVLFWSSGKDSAWTLHVLRQKKEVEVVALITTLNENPNRIAMHAVRETLLEEQAKAADLALWKVQIPKPCSNEHYELAMHQVLSKAKMNGVTVAVFGDLFLEDIRNYREKFLAGTGIFSMFPIWGKNTLQLSREMIDSGLKARIICVDQKQLSQSFAGREFDHQFLSELPSNVDPCGERGEFHTFAYGGPMFSREIPIVSKGTFEEAGFVFVDLKLR